MYIVETLAKNRRLYPREGKGCKTIGGNCRDRRRASRSAYVGKRQASAISGAKRLIRCWKRTGERLCPTGGRPASCRNEVKRALQALIRQSSPVFRSARTSQTQASLEKPSYRRHMVPVNPFQLEGSEEAIQWAGEWVKLKVAHFHLCYSGLFFRVAYRNEPLEMRREAHDPAFQLFDEPVRNFVC